MQPCSHADPLNTLSPLKDSSDSCLSAHNSFSQRARLWYKMTEYALAWECMLKPRYYEMWLRREHDCTAFTQIWLYIKQHTVWPLLQIFPAEQWSDTHRHWCGASSGQLIRTPVDNTGVTAYGLWLISSRPLAAERSSCKAWDPGTQYTGHTGRYYATARHC